MAAQPALPVTHPPDLPLLLLTRPQPQAERFATEARAACPPHRTLIAPLTEIARHPIDPAPLRGATLIFTSVNGVAAVAGLELIKGQTAWCVGPATAAAARAAGFEVRESGGDAVHLLADLRAARPAGPLLHLRGRHAACDLAAVLTAEGLNIRAVIAYEARFCPWSKAVIPALAAASCVIAPLFSPRAAEGFAQRLAGLVPKGLRLVAISPACADRLPPALRARCRIAERPDGAAMLRSVADELSHTAAKP